MKSKSLIGRVVAFMLIGCSVSYAMPGSYFPPERIDCILNDANNPYCMEFNRDFLTEDFSNAVLKQDKHKTFYFYSAVAYATADQSYSVFYTYRNYLFETIKLKTVSPAIRPDLTSGEWLAKDKDMYVCTAGYMSCSITKL